jgi:hypothetical protein
MNEYNDNATQLDSSTFDHLVTLTYHLNLSLQPATLVTRVTRVTQPPESPESPLSPNVGGGKKF